MKTLTYILTFLTLFFGGNIVAFIFIDDYRFLLRKIKYPEMTVYVNESKITDEYGIIEIEEPDKQDIFIEEVSISDDTKVDEENIEENNIEDSSEAEIDFENVLENDDFVFEFFPLNDYEREFLGKFKDFSLSEKDSPSNLFGFIFDFDDDFGKYSSDVLELYFMGDYKYEDIKKLFIDSSNEKGFEINEVNNFGDRSFYVNVEPFVVRVVFEKNERLFMLEVLKTEYDKVKNILNSL